MTRPQTWGVECSRRGNFRESKRRAITKMERMGVHHGGAERHGQSAATASDWMKWMPGTTWRLRRWSLVMNRSTPAADAQASWMASAGCIERS